MILNLNRVIYFTNMQNFLKKISIQNIKSFQKLYFANMYDFTMKSHWKQSVVDYYFNQYQATGCE